MPVVHLASATRELTEAAQLEIDTQHRKFARAPGYAIRYNYGYVNARNICLRDGTYEIA